MLCTCMWLACHFTESTSFQPCLFVSCFLVTLRILDANKVYTCTDYRNNQILNITLACNCLALLMYVLKQVTDVVTINDNKLKDGLGGIGYYVPA